MKKFKLDEKNFDKACLGLLVIVGGLLFYNLYTIIFAVHDDLLMYMYTRNHEVIPQAAAAAKQGRLPQLWDFILLSVPFMLNKVWFYKLIAYASCIFDVWAMWYFLAKHIDKTFAYICAILFFSFATVSANHNLFISYALCHQIPIGLFLLSLHLFIDCYKKRKAWKAVLCCVLYLACCMIYEAFLMYMIVFGVAACILNGREKRPFWKFVRSTAAGVTPLLLTALAYVLVYKLWQHWYPAQYGGIRFYLSEPFSSIKAVWNYSLSMFPLGAAAKMSEEKPFGARDIIRGITPASAVKALLVTASAVFFVFKKGGKVKCRAVLPIAAAGIFVPNILIGLSEKYVESSKHGVTSYITSFYSYVFLVIFLLGVCCVLYSSLKSDNLRILYLICTGFMVFGLSIAADLNIDYWKGHYTALDRRYRNFDRAVSSDTVTDCDSNWEIYAPDNMGIHAKEEYNLGYLKIYDDTPAGRYIRNENELEDGREIMCLRSDENYLLMTAGETDRELCSEEITIVTILPQTFDIILQTESGEEEVYTNVSDGTVIHCPDNDPFDMHFRVAVKK